MIRARALVLVALLVCSLVALPALAAGASETDDEYVTDIGTSHDLDSADAVSEFGSQGYAEADMSRIDMTVTVAESKDDVGLEDELRPTDSANDFLRFQYNEEAERTVRILIPDDYWTPYEREEVDSLTTGHVADYDVVRSGDYQAVTLHFDGPADVVVPAEWVASFSYQNLERVDERLNKSVGVSFRGDNSEWTYVDGKDMADGPGYSIGEGPGDVTVQYDATPDAPEETWINAPEGETLSDGIYYYQRDSENGTVYIVSKIDDPPNVRYNTNPTFMDRARGDINELKTIPGQIEEKLGGLLG